MFRGMLVRSQHMLSPLATAQTWSAAVEGTSCAWAMIVVPQTNDTLPANCPVPTPMPMTVALNVLNSP